MKPVEQQFTGQKSEDLLAIKKVADIIRKGGMGVLPTDTLYGVVAGAFNKAGVAKIYKLKGRDEKKPFIILIGSVKDLKLFGITLSGWDEKFLCRVWPGMVSVVLPCLDPELRYLHRGQESLAFRMPNDKKLRVLLSKTGPVVAPSANLQGWQPAKNIMEAKSYFKNRIDFYLDGGEKTSLPSTLIQIENRKIKVLRKGAVKFR